MASRRSGEESESDEEQAALGQDYGLPDQHHHPAETEGNGGDDDVQNGALTPARRKGEDVCWGCLFYPLFLFFLQLNFFFLH